MSYSQQKHIINKLQVDVETQDPATAFDLKDQLDTFLKNEIFPYLENYFATLEEDLQDQIIQIPYLEVDVKTSSVLNYKELKEDVKRALVKNIENLTKQAHPNNEKATLITSAQGTEQEFIHFLEKGTLPWWSRGENAFEMNEEEFERMISSKKFASRMRKKLMKAAVKKRIIQQLSNQQLKRVWEQLSAENKGISISDTAVSLLDSVSTSMRQIVWNCLLDFTFQNDVETLVSRLLFSLTEEVSIADVSLTIKSKNETNNKNRLASKLILSLLVEIPETPRVNKALELLKKSQSSARNEDVQENKTSEEATENTVERIKNDNASLTEDVKNHTSENWVKENPTNDSTQEVTAKDLEKGEVSKNQHHDPKATAEGSKSPIEETHHDPKVITEESKATNKSESSQTKDTQETLANSTESRESDATKLKEQGIANSKMSKDLEKGKTTHREESSESKQILDNPEDNSKELSNKQHDDPKAMAEGLKVTAEGSKATITSESSQTKDTQETLANSTESRESDAAKLKEQGIVNSKMSKDLEKGKTAHREESSESKQILDNPEDNSKELSHKQHHNPKVITEGSQATAEGSNQTIQEQQNNKSSKSRKQSEAVANDLNENLQTKQEQNSGDHKSSKKGHQTHQEISKTSATSSDENPEEEATMSANELKTSLTQLLDEQDQKLFKELHRRQLQVAQKKEERGEFQVSNAGLIMLHPYFKPFFDNCGLLNEDNTLNNPDLAVHLLHYLATKQEQQFESNMLFEKMLCGVHSETPIQRNIVLSEEMKSDAEDLLTSVLQNWDVLKNASPDLLRGEFLTRFGRISFKENNPKLTVERKVQDVLLDKLPWGIGICRLPWLNYLLFTDW